MELHRQSQSDLCKRAVRLLPPYCFHFVADGLRWTEDVAFFRERYGAGVVHLHICASRQLRKERYDKRDKDVPFEEADSHEVEQEVPLVGSMADVVIANEGTLRGFYRSIRDALELELYAR
jgi:dephospho-CoA kinase